MAADWQMWSVLVAVGVVVILYALERFSIEIVSAGAIAFFLLFFQLFPLPNGGFGAHEILSGFGNPALVTILALLVVGQGMFQTGAMEGPSRALANLHGRFPTVTMGGLFLFVMTISAFVNNTPVVIMFIPVLVSIAGRIGTSPSRVMMPLSYVSILAGMTTLIGSSTNLLVSQMLKENEHMELGFFTQTPLGLILACAGIVYLLVLGRFLIPERVIADNDTGTGRQYLAQIEITSGHAHEGDTPVAGMFPELSSVSVRLIQRGIKTFLPPFSDEVKLQDGDILTIAATRKALSDLLVSDASLPSSMLKDMESHEDGPGDLALTEAVVAPNGRYVGRTLGALDFQARTGCVVLGVERKAKMVRRPLRSIRLEGGDDLLIFGTVKNIRAMRYSRDLLVLLWAMRDVPDLRRATIARAIFGMIVLLAATGLLPILHTALLGAIAMIATQCLNLRQAARALDLRIFMLIGAAFAMCGAMQATGAAHMIAHTAVEIAQPFGFWGLLVGLFGIVAILTNVLSNAATAVLFSPIALQAAEQFAQTPAQEQHMAVAAILTVIYAANCSFATPIAYQTNLLVMGPGHYRFLDYLRVGGPLILLLWLVFAVASPYVLGIAGPGAGQ